MMSTRFTEDFGLRYPIISAPMVAMSGPDLAAAVSRAGGLGSFGGVVAKPFDLPPDYVRDSIARVRAATDRPFAVGFITHHLQENSTDFDLALAEEVPVILLSFTDPRPWLRRIKARGLRAVCQVQTMEEAHWAADEGADAISVQGNEAGGHCGALNLLPFLVQAREAFVDLPVLVSGGVASGRSLAAVLAAGADGAWIGTGFRATSDCTEISPEERAEILKSDGRNTSRQHVNDTITRHSFGFMPWPGHIGLRSKTTPLVEAWTGRETALAEEATRDPSRFAAIYDDPGAENYPHIFGEAAGFVTQVETAEGFMSRITAEAVAHLQAAAARVST